MSRGWKGGSTRRWRKIREGVLRENYLRTGGRCQVALAGTCTGWADQVHHTRGRAETGDDPRFLVASCRACNLKIGEPKASPPPRPRSSW